MPVRPAFEARFEDDKNRKNFAMKLFRSTWPCRAPSVWKGHEVRTGIFKEPVEGPVMMRRLNLDGDRQADLTVHGGPAKAVYAYPSEHYPLWKSELTEMALPWGMFGENLTTEGMMEDEIHIGDKFRIGEAIVIVTQPRTPCYKLALKFQRDDMLKRMLTNGRSGFYFAVVQQGVVRAGDAIERIHEDPERISVAEINTLYRDGGKDANLLKRAANLEALPENWRDYLREELKSLEHAT